MSDQASSADEPTTVFIGSAANMSELLDPKILDPLLATANIGLYGHFNGVFQLFQSGNEPTLVQDFGQASGVAEFGEPLGFATGYVDITNNSLNNINIYIGSDLKADNGNLFSITNDYHAAPIGYDEASGKYYYTVDAGQAIDVPIEAEGLGVSYNLSADSITSILGQPNLTVSSSTSTTGGQAWTSFSQNGSVNTDIDQNGNVSVSPGFFTNTFAQYPTFFPTEGYNPAEANVNVDSSHAWTQQDLNSWEGYVQNARSWGIMNVAPIFTDNDYTADLSQPFATSPWYTYAREAALYGGGLSFDLPPNYAFAREPAYLENVVQQIQWANQNGLRTSVIISPYDIDGSPNNFDDDFLSATQKLVSYLTTQNALPSQFIVENYNSDATGTFYSESGQNSLNAVAEYLAGVKLNTTNSESGLESTDPSPDIIVTGLGPSITADTAEDVFGNLQIFDSDSSRALSVTINFEGGGWDALDPSLPDSPNVVVLGGGNVEISGSVTDVTTSIQNIHVAPKVGLDASYQINFSVDDSVSSVNVGTSVSVDTHVPLAPTLGMTQDRLVIRVAEDSWIVNAQFTVSVDGHQLGGIQTTTASESAGSYQDFAFTGSFGTGPHVVTVNFLNDVYGGTAAKDTNLYVKSLTLDGQTTSEKDQELAYAGPANFTLAAAPAAVPTTQPMVIDSAQPMLQGVAEAGASVSVNAALGSTQISLGTTIASSTGAWSLAPAKGLADGTYLISATQTDVAGTTSAASVAQSVTIDTHVPLAPTLGVATDTLALNVSEDTSAVPTTQPMVIDSAQPMLQGVAEAGASVSVNAALGSTQISLGTTIASSTGAWSLAPAKGLADGTYLISATQTDVAGTTSAASVAQSITIDTHVPLAPTLGVATDTLALNVSEDTSAVPTTQPMVIDSAQPMLQGVAEAGASVSVNAALGSTQISLGTTIASSTGAWSLAPAKGLADGTYLISATQTDVAGTTSAASVAQSITIDTHVPLAPTLGVATDTLALNVSEDTSAVPTTQPMVIDSAQPMLQGVAEAGASVSVNAALGSTQISLGTTIASSTGAWSLAPAKGLADGTYLISATQTDVAGTTSAASVAQSITIDTHVPLAPTLGMTQDRLVVRVAEDSWIVNAQFTVSVDGHQLGGIQTTTASESAGSYQDFAFTGSFGTGPHVVTVNFLNDVYGGTAAKDTNLYVKSLTLDGQTTSEKDQELAYAGPANFTLAAAMVIDSAQPMLQGVAEAGASVSVNAALGSTQISLGTTIASSTGAWSLAPAKGLADGTYLISATQTDVAGTTSAASVAQSITIDTHVPLAPTLGMTQDRLVVRVAEDSWIVNAQFTVSVDGHQLGGIQTTTASESAGSYQDFAFTGSFGTGPHVVTVNFLNDVYGGTAAKDTNLYVKSLTLDGQTTSEKDQELAYAGPANFTLAAAPAAVPTTQPMVIDSAQPMLQGVAEAGASVSVNAVLGSTQISLGTTIASSTGAWSLAPAKGLADGTYLISATQTDVAGTTSAASVAQSITIDTHVPLAPTLGMTQDRLVVRVAEDSWIVNAQFTVSVDGHQLGGIQTTTASESAGSYQDFAFTGSFGTGPHVVTVNFLNDVYGGTAAKDTNLYVKSLTLDGQTTSEKDQELAYAGPANFTLAAAPAAVPTTQPMVIDSAQPMLQGVAEAGASVSVNAALGSTQISLGTTIASSTGAWSLAPAKGLADGTYLISATQTDVAGTTSAASVAQSITIDTHVPLAPTLGMTQDRLVVRVAEDSWIVNAQFTVSVDGHQLGGIQTTTASESAGSYQDFAFTGSFGTGPHVVTVNFLNDVYGGTAAKDTNLYVKSLTLDGQTTSEKDQELAYAGPANFTLAAAMVIDSAQPMLQGVAEAGASVSVNAALGSTQISLGTTIASSTGAWSLAPAKGLADGTYLISATQTDVAGTTSAASVAHSITIDTHVPLAPTLGMTQDRLVVRVAEDSWIVNAQFTVSVDGHQLGGIQTTTASESAGSYQDFAFTGSFGTGPHVVTVNFLNDVYGGTAAKDTNLYVKSLTLDGQTTSEKDQELAYAGPANFTLAAAPAAVPTTQPMVIDSAQPMLQGVAEAGASVSVNAVLGSTQISLGTTIASSTGAWSLAPAKGLADGTYLISATQTDVAGTTSAASVAQSITIDTHVPLAPTLGVATDTLALNVSEDTSAADAQFTVSVDGTQVGGIYSTNALKNAGKSQIIALNGMFGAGPHQVAVSFLNADYGSTTATANNLYVNSVTLDGQTTVENTKISTVSTANFTVDLPTTVNSTIAAGLVATDVSRPIIAGTAEAGSTVVVTANSGSQSITLGSVTSASDGSWNLTPSAPLDSGIYQLTALQTDKAGTSSSASAPLTLNVYFDPAKASAKTASVFSSDTMHFIASNSVIGVNSGSTIIEAGSKNTYLLPATGNVSLTGNLLSNSDILDFSKTMSSIGWDNNDSDLGKYISLSTVNGGADLVITTHAAGSVVAALVVDLPGQGAVTLPTLEQHTVFS